MLKTKCNSCVFNEINLCLIDKKLVIDGDDSYVEGYCNFRRSDNWRKKYEIFSTNHLLGIVTDEEKKVALIINALDNDLDKLIITIDSIKTSTSFFDEIIIVVNKIRGERLNDFIKVVRTLKYKWTLDNLEEEADENLIIDYSTRLINSFWFATIKSGENVEFLKIDQIKERVINPRNTFAAFYFADHPYSFVANKFAYIEMGGNFQKNFIDKLKEFENWENACLQII